MSITGALTRRLAGPLRVIFTAAAWGTLAVISYATLSPSRVVYKVYDTLAPTGLQPEIATYVHLEHVAAFAVLGALFALAYPRHRLRVCCLVLGLAGLLEVLQTLTPDRHGHILDALEKMAGGAMGVAIAPIVLSLQRRLPK